MHRSIWLTITTSLLVVALISLYAWQAAPAAHASGSIYYVNDNAGGANSGASWADAFTSLQSALSAANSGDQIWVAEGTYTPSSSGDRSASFTLKSGVAIYGGFAGTETQLSERSWTSNPSILSGDLNGDDEANFTQNGDNSYRVVTGVTGGTLDGFTITAGNATEGFWKGGGIYNDQADPILSNLIISGNFAADGGAGIYNNAASPTITNVTISANSAQYGGAIYFEGGSSATVTDVIVRWNTADRNGGGIYLSYSNPTLSNLTLSNNRASHNGGGMYLSFSAPTVSNATISNNTATLNGGGIAVQNTSTLTLTDAVMTGNSSSGSRGGALQLENSAATVLNVVVSGNNAASGGGIISENSVITLTNALISGNRANALAGGFASWKGNATLTNVTISGNYVADDGVGLSGGGIDAYNGGTTTLRNSIVWGNLFQGEPSAIFAGNGSTVVASSNIIEGGYDGTLNLNVDPQFINAPSADAAPSSAGDFRLQISSPAIDLGDNEVTNPSLPAGDLSGNSRRIDVPSVPDSGNGSAPLVDLGAYEGRFVTSVVTRLNPADSATNADHVTFRVVFSEPVDGLTFLTVPDYFLANTLGTVIPDIAPSDLSGSGTTYDVTWMLGQGSGLLRMDVLARADLTDSQGLPFILPTNTDGEVYEIYRTNPDAPIFTGLTDDSGVVANTSTADTTISLNGTAAARATVTLTRVGTGVIGTTSADDSGNWVFDYTGTVLPQGMYSFTAIATDPLNQTGPASAPFTVTIREPLIWYVDDDAAGTSGTSWQHAFSSPQQALSVAGKDDQVWVAAGIYRPSTQGDRSASFNLKGNVALYGGFAGSETALDQRNWTANVSAFSGDLNGDDNGFSNNGENSYLVVNGANGALLDGFTISGGNANETYIYGAGIAVLDSTMSLANLIISGNYTEGLGGGIYSLRSTLTLSDVTISGNQAGDYGGAAHIENSTVTMVGGAIINNTAADNGGGLHNVEYSTLTLTDVTLSGNTVTNPNRSGGALYNINSSANLTYVTISDNESTFLGGGILNGSNAILSIQQSTINSNNAFCGGALHSYSTATVTITNSLFDANQGGSCAAAINNNGNLTISGSLFSNNIASTTDNNQSLGTGGALQNSTGPNHTVLITNSTFTGNQAQGSDDDGGGAIMVYHGAITLNNVTISGNSTASTGLNGSSGGGISIRAFDPVSITLNNTIVAGNTSGGGAPNLSGAFTSGGHNLIGDGSGSSGLSNGVNGDLVGTAATAIDPLLAVLADNGGPTQTMALGEGSPAIDAGNAATCSSTDQRGYLRVVPCDIGAFELNAPAPLNQVPTLDALANLTILEDAGPQTVALSGISAGAGEVGQILTITASSSNPALIPNLSVTYTNPNSSGSVNFTPVANGNGSATITIVVRDNAGSLNNGTDTLTHTFMVNVTAVNDAPDFALGPNLSVAASDGPHTATGWATGFTPGPTDEATQTMLAYIVTDNNAPELFDVAPAIDSAGTLTFTPKPGAGGTATISVVVRDNGGTANGGNDTSVVRTFTITIMGDYRIYLPLLAH